jgi:phosphatidate cytidylyltransferase
VTAGKSSSLNKRILSGLILGPATLAIIYFGSLPFIVFVLVAVAISAYEWLRMAKLSPKPKLISALGLSYLVIAGAAFIDLRLRHNGGTLVMGLLLCVWAADIGAYMTGKLIGGPKLCPKISPNKTWAGLGGSMFFGGLVLALYVFYADTALQDAGLAFIAGLIFGVIGQAGDLMISMLKRRVGFKDTGNLIPGHGGLLDRIDSLLLVAPVFLLAYVLCL